MAELSLTEVFGAGATQDATKITILKADLAGLTATANNKADALAVGIINRFKAAYPLAAREADKDVSLVVSASSPQILNDAQVVNNQLVNTSYLNKPVTIDIYSLFSSSPPVPDDY